MVVKFLVLRETSIPNLHHTCMSLLELRGTINFGVDERACTYYLCVEMLLDRVTWLLYFLFRRFRRKILSTTMVPNCGFVIFRMYAIRSSIIIVICAKQLNARPRTAVWIPFLAIKSRISKCSSSLDISTFCCIFAQLTNTIRGLWGHQTDCCTVIIHSFTSCERWRFQ